MSKKSKWLAIARIAAHMGDMIVPGISAVESLAEKIPSLHGADKQDAVVQIVKDGLATIEGGAGKDLLNDPEVVRLTKAVIDAQVALHNGLAAKAAPASS